MKVWKVEQPALRPTHDCTHAPTQYRHMHMHMHICTYLEEFAALLEQWGRLAAE